MKNKGSTFAFCASSLAYMESGIYFELKILPCPKSNLTKYKNNYKIHCIYIKRFLSAKR